MESANIVGYNNTAAREGLNFYAPAFLTVGANTIDINDIKLDDGGTMSVGWGDVMQVVGPKGETQSAYFYWDPSMDPNEKATTYYWGDDACFAVNTSFDSGDGIAFDNMNAIEFNIQNAGQVPTGKVTVSSREGLIWSGNPFPAPINLNAIVLNDGGAMSVGWGDVLQIVDSKGGADFAYFYWDASMDPEEKATSAYWGDDGCFAVNATLEPGAGFAIDNMNGLEFNIEIACPY